MRAKSLIMIGMIAGSTLGGYVPSLWGASGLTLASVLFGGIGGMLGIWAGYRLSRW
jgi:predicted MFS family arabinose efflux permease